MRVYWEITTNCNSGCDYCFYRQFDVFGRHLTNADVPTALLILKKIKPTNLVLTGGEPALLPDLPHTFANVRKIVPQTQIRIITGASDSLFGIEESARLHLIDAVTFSDHKPKGRSYRLRFIESLARHIDVNVIIPVHRFRLTKCRDIVRQYLTAGCTQASFNVLVFSDLTDPRSLIHCSQTEQDELLALAQTEAGHDAFMSLKNQLSFLQPRVMVNNLCKAAFDFVFLNSDSQIMPCPYWNDDKASISTLSREKASQCPEDNIELFQLKRVMTLCQVHGGCVCINGKLDWKEP
jgi:hypothetical protein